jgi:hypothetical protein
LSPEDVGRLVTSYPVLGGGTSCIVSFLQACMTPAGSNW